MIMRLRELIIALKNEGKQLSYGREIKYHRSTAKYPVLDRNWKRSSCKLRISFFLGGSPQTPLRMLLSHNLFSFSFLA